MDWGEPGRDRLSVGVPEAAEVKREQLAAKKAGAAEAAEAKREQLAAKNAAAAEAKRRQLPPKKKSAAKAGAFPVLSRWKQNRDDSITGFVSNSDDFEENERITTSPIVDPAAGGSVVRTASGSRYFLADDAKSTGGNPFGAFGKKPAKTAPAPPVAEVQRSTGGNLFGAFGKKPKEAAGPPGVPTLSKWEENDDGSITGRVNNSDSFDKNELINTSPLRKNSRPRKGAIVVTGSGSQYYLT